MSPRDSRVVDVEWAKRSPTFIEEDNEQEEDSFKLEKILDVRLNINSPIFICPLNDQECWCLHFGSLTVKSNRNEKF